MPSAPRHSHLLLIQDDKGEREFFLNESHYSIGRGQECSIRLISLFVSRHHATLVRQNRADGTYFYRIIDGDAKGQPSSNGLLINGKRRRSHDLENKDEVIFGPQVRLIYHQLKRDAFTTVPPDPEEFDITLINPGTAEFDDESDEDLKLLTYEGMQVLELSDMSYDSRN